MMGREWRQTYRTHKPMCTLKRDKYWEESRREEHYLKGGLRKIRITGKEYYGKEERETKYRKRKCLQEEYSKRSDER